MSSVEVFDASTASGRVTRPSSRERRLLQLHVLEHGFDDDVDLIEAVIGRRRRDERQRLFERLGRHASLRDRRFVVPADRRQAAIEGCVIDLLQQHRDPGICIRHRDAAAHRPGADDGGAGDAARRRVFGHVGNLGRFALGKEQMHHRARLGRQHAIGEQLALTRRARVEVHRHGRFDGVDARQGRARTARGLRQHRSRRLHRPPIPSSRFAIRGLDSRVLRRLAELRASQRKRHRAVEQVAGHDLVDDAFGLCARRGDELPSVAQLERRLRPG